MRLKLGVLSLSLLSISQGAFAVTESGTVRVIIKYKEQAIGVSSLKAQILKSTHLPIKQMKPMANGAYSLILETQNSSFAKNSDAASLTILKQLRKNPNVLYAVKDRIGYIKPVPKPAIKEEPTLILSHELQWNEFKRPGGVFLESEPGQNDGAWSYTRGESHKMPVVVAVLDTGIALNDSIVGNLVKDRRNKVFGWNFADNNNDLSDATQSYHGTHVAGIIAGYGNIMNGMGPDLKVLPIKVADAEGMFYESAVINAIYWSVGADVPGVPVNHAPAKVLNMSFGVDENPGKEKEYCDEALQEAVFFARDQGAVLAVAAGNDNVWEHYNAPAVCNGTLKIASTGPEGLRSYFSNYGPGISFAAPGGDLDYGTAGGILSTVDPDGGYNNSGFDFFQGTSMASPHVAGVAGLMFAVAKGTLKPEKAEQILYTTTHDFGKSTNSNKSCVGKKPCGHGILDAENAVKAVLKNYDVVFSAPKVALLNTKTCGTSMVSPGVNTVQTDDSVWIQTHASCEATQSYQKPHVEQDKDGVIYAYYGAVKYQLDQTPYSACDVIGYDGIGCYR